MNKKNTPGSEDRYFSRAVNSALRILDLLKGERVALGLSEISRRTGINKSSAFRFLYTMEVTGHIIRDENGRYSASGPGLDYVALVSAEKLIKAALPHMKGLRSRYSETVSLGILLKNHIEAIKVLESPKLIRMSNRVGAIIPPHASSMGKAITAFQDDELQERLINGYGMMRLTDKTITDDASLMQEYSAIRKRGWSQDNRESALEGQCFGAPIRFEEKVIAAVSISFPVYRVLKGEPLRLMIADLRKTAETISRQLTR